VVFHRTEVEGLMRSRDSLHTWEIRTPSGWVPVDFAQLERGDIVRYKEDPNQEVFKVKDRPTVNLTELSSYSEDFCPKCGADYVRVDGIAVHCSNWQHPDVESVYAEGGLRNCDVSLKNG